MFSSTSKWNTAPGSTRTAHSGMRSKVLGLSSWLTVETSYGYSVAASNSPQWEVYYHASAYANRANGSWSQTSVGTNNQPAFLATCSTTFPYDYHRFASQVAGTPTPPPSTDYNPRVDPSSPPRVIRMPSGVVGAPAPDGHLCVVQPDGTIFEAYAAVVLQAWGTYGGSGGGIIVCETYNIIDSTGDGHGYANGPRASMLPASAGLLHAADLNGTVNAGHALAIVVPPSVLDDAWVSPALAFDTDAFTNSVPYSGDLPMGTKLSIPSGFNVTGLATANGRRIARTIRDYGAIIADRGGSGVTIMTALGITSPADLASYDASLDSDLQAIAAAWEVAT